MCWHEKEHSLLHLVKDEPVSNHEEQVPKVQGAEKVEYKDHERYDTGTERVALVLALDWLRKQNLHFDEHDQYEKSKNAVKDYHRILPEFSRA